MYIYANIFAEKICVAFVHVFAKATHFSAKLDIVLTRAVNILTTNELVNDALNNWAQFDLGEWIHFQIKYFFSLFKRGLI